MEWMDVLWFRDPGSVPEVAERLQAHGLERESVDQVLQAYARGEEPGAALKSEFENERQALLAIELDLLGAALRTNAGLMRSASIKELATGRPLAAVAAALGLTRQAASRSANQQPDNRDRLDKLPKMRGKQ